MANKQPTTELNGDLDLFGDGSVYIHRGFARAWKPNCADQARLVGGGGCFAFSSGLFRRRVLTIAAPWPLRKGSGDSYYQCFDGDYVTQRERRERLAPFGHSSPVRKSRSVRASAFSNPYSQNAELKLRSPTGPVQRHSVSSNDCCIAQSARVSQLMAIRQQYRRSCGNAARLPSAPDRRNHASPCL